MVNCNNCIHFKDVQRTKVTIDPRTQKVIRTVWLGTVARCQRKTDKGHKNPFVLKTERECRNFHPKSSPNLLGYTKNKESD